MLGRIIEVIRWALYGLVLYNSIGAGWWVTIGFLLTFFYLEVSILAISVLRKNIEMIKEMKDKLEAILKVAEAKNDPFGEEYGYEFSSTTLTEEEEDYLKLAESGEVEGLENFLASRCTDKTVDFTTVPIPVKLIMTAKVLASVERGKQSKTEADWADVIEDTSDNN